MRIYSLNEEMNYNPEKIDQFVDKARTELESIEKGYKQALNLISNATLKDVADNPERFNTLLEKVASLKKLCKDKYGQYFDVVEMYDWMDRPKNVKELEDMANTIDEYGDDVNQLHEVLKEMLYVVKRMGDKLKDKED
jgi:DNA repair ATPase RecN